MQIYWFMRRPFEGNGQLFSEELSGVTEGKFSCGCAVIVGTEGAVGF